MCELGAQYSRCEYHALDNQNRGRTRLPTGSRRHFLVWAVGTLGRVRSSSFSYRERFRHRTAAVFRQPKTHAGGTRGTQGTGGGCRYEQVEARSRQNNGSAVHSAEEILGATR